MNLIDVTTIEPRRKHPAIFERFAGLNPGESFIILNDHDPMPLYYQMLAELGPVFIWEYLERGPLAFRVKISRKTADEQEATIGQIVAADFRKAEVFKKFGLDFCCGGKKTIREACFEKGIMPDEVEKALEQPLTSNYSTSLDYDSWDLDFLVSYIVNQHHKYTRMAMEELTNLGQKVSAVHGLVHPELYAIRERTDRLMAELKQHMFREEEILFPYIQRLVYAERQHEMPVPAGFGTVRNPVGMMVEDHEEAGALLEEIAALSNNFTLPEDACSSYTVFYKRLQEFQDDLKLHIHLENNVLFPKAIELEKSLYV